LKPGRRPKILPINEQMQSAKVPVIEIDEPTRKPGANKRPINSEIAEMPQPSIRVTKAYGRQT
jgi:hypothetical protein